MATSLYHYAAPEEVRRLAVAPELAAQLNTCAVKKPFVFFAGFDGANNDKNNLALLGNPYQTNTGNLAGVSDVSANNNVKMFPC
ncbi:MAG: hypothetical protein FWG56_03180 [Desulfovibrionaceae bacterium]|nr:hypothetical protein [Desulfovibrionaceae bacterium]